MMLDNVIVERAPAKLNLVLHVRRRRADGYHDLETLFAFAQDGDTVTVARAKADAFAITGPFADALVTTDDNLVTSAKEAFWATFAINGSGVAITLDKHLPVASGIGGGSADAAATLRALARLYGKPLDSPLLFQCAASLGADVPACLFGRTALGTGRGDALLPLEPLGGVPTLLVNPGAAVPTAAVFARWDGVDRGGIARGAVLDVARSGRNDLQAPALRVAPAIGEVLTRLEAMPGTTLVRMSGSGATCFALFETAGACSAAAATLADERQGWWLLETRLT